MRKVVAKRETPGSTLHELLLRVRSGQKPIILKGLHGAPGRLLSAILFEDTDRPLIWISPTEKEAKAAMLDFSYFLGAGRVMHYPAWEILALEMFGSQRESERIRMGTLFQLICGNPLIIVTSVPALLQKTIPRKFFEEYIQAITTHDTVDRDILAAKLAEEGYSQSTLVEEPGEYSLRGNILDLFIPSTAFPYRLEFFGDDLESIRTFDPATQRSTGEVKEFFLPPASELVLTHDRRQSALKRIRDRSVELDLPRTVRDRLTERLESGLYSFLNPLYLSLFYGNLDGLTDYLPSRSLLVLDDPMLIYQQTENFHNDLDRFFMKAGGKDYFHPKKEDAFFTSFPEFGDLQTLRLEGLTFKAVEGNKVDEGSAISLPIEEVGPLRTDGMQRIEASRLALLADRIRAWLAEGNHVHFVCGGHESRQRIDHLLSPYGFQASPMCTPLLKEIEGCGSSGKITAGDGKVSGSFYLPALSLAVISDETIFGRRFTRHRVRPAREGFFLKSFSELMEGDFVVHTEHGIGRYLGLHKLTAGGITNDFLLVQYQEQDKLYVPIDRLDFLQRYVGPEGFTPRLDRMGGTSWSSVKQKLKRSIREVAEELVAIYATREVMERLAYSPLGQIYDEFCSAFEYEETPDQNSAIEDIHLDMGGSRPMDRLICGDAGFGKTEVALRSSFRVAMDGRQVAVIVPTTILAEQHYQTFSRRFAPYPIRVEVLNRFRSRAVQSEIVKGLQNGTVDIIIGTHRLLQKEIAFRDLGLVIIDEEQRFGVQHKEKLKKLRTLVDVLTLSATPIPRTLHLSLIGIRDLSIINTPPEDRQPIRTYVLEFSEDVIREGIRRELERGGQAFFVHDRVKSIYSMARLVSKLVPEARIGVIHGQLKASEIESSMVKFIRREYDVLVCSSIIGSGVDIPAANTIFINRAERFGLAHLYQIRGRVGRSKEEACAYLFVPKGAMLSREAQKRLQAIQDFTEPGSGFRIASSDLDIRGAGSLLGVSQSGHISAVGYELYTELMAETIREIKGEETRPEEVRPEIHLGLPAYLPESYIDDEHRRLAVYKRLSLAGSDEEIFDIREELLDCFGSLPMEADNLLEVIRIRNRLRPLRIRRMGYDGQQFLMSFSPDSPIDPGRIVDLLVKAADVKRQRAAPGKSYKGLDDRHESSPGTTWKSTRIAKREPILTTDMKLYIPVPGLIGADILRRANEIIRRLGDP
jgi:transcription-repair coupling factor (superfamily II helicase)